ncbi:MAG: hypothetical protein U1E53_03450 [Dongiaceae bacterium]
MDAPVRRYAALRICPERADAAFPLARIAAPALTIERWRGLVRGLAEIGAGGGSGILLAEDESRYIYGLCTFHSCLDLQQGEQVLNAELVVPNLIDPRPVAGTLLRAMRSQAEASDCRAVIVHLPVTAAATDDRPRGLQSALADAGFAATPMMRWRLPVPPRGAAKPAAWVVDS